MNKSDRAALRVLLERATPGPWEAWEGCRAGMPERERALMQHVDHNAVVIAMQRDTLRSWAFEDFAFVAAARNSLAGLLDALDAADALRDAEEEFRDMKSKLDVTAVCSRVDVALAAYNALVKR